MVVGILRLTLSIQGAHSLKDKRRVIHKIVDRARSRYNASVAEVGDNDLSQRAQLGVTVVSNDRRFVDEVLAKLTRDVEANADASLLARELEIENYSQMREAPRDKPNLNPTELNEDWDVDAEERALAGAEDETNPVGGGDAGGEAFSGDDEKGDWLTESDLEGEAK